MDVALCDFLVRLYCVVHLSGVRGIIYDDNYPCHYGAARIHMNKKKLSAPLLFQFVVVIGVTVSVCHTLCQPRLAQSAVPLWFAWFPLLAVLVWLPPRHPRSFCNMQELRIALPLPAVRPQPWETLSRPRLRASSPPMDTSPPICGRSKPFLVIHSASLAMSLRTKRSQLDNH